MDKLLNIIDALQSAVDIADGKNTLFFITTNGVFFGSKVKLNYPVTKIENADDLMLSVYSNATLSGNDSLEQGVDKTILIKDVTWKTGDENINSKYTILNLDQIVSVQISSKESMSQFLNQQ